MAPVDDERAMRTACTGLAELPEAEWRYFWSQTRTRHFAPREQLVREGRPATAIHFIVSGLVRLYYNRDGRELVRGFDFENRWATVYESVLTGEPSTFSIEALEPTRTISFTGDVLRALYNRHPCWDRFGRRILEAQWIRQSDKARRFRIYTPEEHYRLLIDRKSPLLDRVPLHQLASYLQITPETLAGFGDAWVARSELPRRRGARFFEASVSESLCKSGSTATALDSNQGGAVRAM